MAFDKPCPPVLPVAAGIRRPRPRHASGILACSRDDLFKNGLRRESLRPLTNVLASLGIIDAVEANPDGGTIPENGDGVPIRDTDHLASELLIRANRLECENTQQNRERGSQSEVGRRTPST